MNKKKLPEKHVIEKNASPLKFGVILLEIRLVFPQFGDILVGENSAHLDELIPNLGLSTEQSIHSEGSEQDQLLREIG